MSMQKKTTGNGRTGFWMRVDHKLSVKVVNGTMYKLLNAKKGCILTRILSPRLGHQIVRAWLYRNQKWMLLEGQLAPRGVFYGLFGLKRGLNQRGLVSSTKSRKLKAQKEHPAMSPSTYLNPPFSRLIGLKDGSAYGTVKAFHMRRSGKLTP